MSDGWISGAEAAEIIGVSRNTVYLTLKDEALRAEQWGAKGVGWRYKPLTRRRIFQVSRHRAEELAAGGGDRAEPPPVDPGA